MSVRGIWLVGLLLCVTVLLCGNIARGQDSEEEKEFLYGTFPQDFLWGVATSSHQIEGGWDEDGKSQNIWDTFCLNGRIDNGDDAFVTCDSYHKYEQDITALSNMGVNSYRFSLAWARILPDGERINEAGVEYYNTLINGLLQEGIQPMLTLYHWDMPQFIEDMGGFLNEGVFIYYFNIYARTCFELFGDRVKLWITFNEPFIIANHGYGIGIFAPGIVSPGEALYEVGHTLLKSHAEVWHMYDEEFRAVQAGNISLSLNGGFSAPLTEGETNQNASERAMQFEFGWFGHPVFKNGDYPELMKKRVLERSLAQGFNKSRLPEFTEQEKQRIQGTYDFFGLNHYSSIYVYDDLDRPLSDVSYDADKGVGGYSDPDWPTSGSDWLRATPYFFRYLLRWIQEEYDDPPILITENGISDRNATLQDGHRIYYFKHYINEVMKAITLDGCNIFGYTAWSLMDNFEWAAGYAERFGMHYINFSDPELSRVPKDSALYYGQIIADNGFPDPNPPTTAAEVIVEEETVGSTRGKTDAIGDLTTESYSTTSSSRIKDQGMDGESNDIINEEVKHSKVKKNKGQHKVKVTALRQENGAGNIPKFSIWCIVVAVMAVAIFKN